MKKTLLCLLFLVQAVVYGQSLIARIADNIKNGGKGVVIIHINYVSGGYRTEEKDIITANAANAANILYSVQSHIKDSLGVFSDTTYTLSSSQITLLNNYFSSVSNSSNPNTTLSTVSGAHSTISFMMCCDGQVNLIWSEPVHITLARYLLSDMSNWH